MINCIVAVTNTGIIGDSETNDLLWHLPDDMKRFKDLTMGHVVLMGRKTYESIPERFRPLPGRTNVVCTRDAQTVWPRLETDPPRGALVCSETIAKSIGTYLYYRRRVPDTKMELFVAGGGTIYEQAFDRCDRFYITLVDEKAHGIEDSPSRVRFPIQRLFDGVEAGIFEITKTQSLHGVKYLTIERRPRGPLQTLLRSLFS